MIEYQAHPHQMQKLFELLLSHNEQLSLHFDKMEARNEELEKVGSKEVQQYHEENMELEAELDNLESELEKMRMYETSYHTQEKRL